MKKYLLITFTMICILQSCNKDQSIFVPNENIPVYTNDILGIVTDETGAPVIGARIIYDNQVALTDISGIYHLKKVGVSADQSYLSIEKEGYFAAGRSFASTGDGLIKLKNVLLSKNFSHFLDANTGGSISETNIAIQFPANAFVEKLTGQAYHGQVKVAMRYINPTDLNALNLIPGAPTGLSAKEAVVCLSNFGTVALELEGIIGIPLKLAPDKFMQVQVKLPEALAQKATSVTYLWAFNKNLGYWQENGIASLNGSTFEFNLNQPGYCTLANQIPAKEISSRIVDEQGRPIQFASVRLVEENGNFETKTYTDAQGQYKVKVPINTPLQIWINKNGSCQVSINTKTNINPIRDNIRLPDQHIKLDNTKFYKISGKLISCLGKNVKNGYAIVSSNNKNIAFLIASNGLFEGYLYQCNTLNTVTLTGVNSDSNEKSVAINLPVSNEINLGDVTVCKEEKDFVDISIPAINFDTVAYNNIVFTDGETKTLEASLPLSPAFFGISWSTGGVKGVPAGTYDLLPNKGYIALKGKDKYNFYKVSSGTIKITEGTSSAGKSFKGLFNLDLKQEGRVQPIQAIGSFKSTYRN